MKVKRFNFPSFEDWVNKYNTDWEQKIGVFTCRIADVCVSLKNNKPVSIDYQVAISKHENPLNVYSSKICSKFINCPVEDKEQLYNWYITVIEEINSEWEKYIINRYMVNDID